MCFAFFVNQKAHKGSIISTSLSQQAPRIHFNPNALLSVRIIYFLLNYFFPFMHFVNNTWMKLHHLKTNKL